MAPEFEGCPAVRWTVCSCSPRTIHGGRACRSKPPSAVEDVHTEIRDLAVRAWADMGLVTCVIDQTYRYQGRNEPVMAPTTLLAA